MISDTKNSVGMSWINRWTMKVSTAGLSFLRRGAAMRKRLRARRDLLPLPAEERDGVRGGGLWSKAKTMVTPSPAALVHDCGMRLLDYEKLYRKHDVSGDEMSIRTLDTTLNLYAEHELNASTFAVRVVVGTNSDLHSAIVAGIGALKGPAHGGAPSAVIEQLERIGTAENAEPWMRDARKQKIKFMGFGHRVYRVYDPRAKILKEMCRQMNPRFYELATRVEEVALKILHEEHPERAQSVNVEFYSAGVLQAIGLPKEFFTPTFAVSRVAGWSAHVLEQAAHNRIIRPQSEYIGPEPRKPVPLAERG